MASIEEPCSKLLGTQGECFVKREDVQHKLAEYSGSGLYSWCFSQFIGFVESIEFVAP